MKELESIIAALPARHGGTSNAEEYGMLGADLVAIFNSTLGKTFMFYDFFSCIDYASITYALSEAAENGNGIIVTRQVSWETSGFTQIRNVKYWPAPTLKEWDCSDGYYMENDYGLYGTYTSY